MDCLQLCTIILPRNLIIHLIDSYKWIIRFLGSTIVTNQMIIQPMRGCHISNFKLLEVIPHHTPHNHPHNNHNSRTTINQYPTTNSPSPQQTEMFRKNLSYVAVVDPFLVYSINSSTNISPLSSTFSFFCNSCGPVSRLCSEIKNDGDRCAKCLKNRCFSTAEKGEELVCTPLQNANHH